MRQKRKRFLSGKPMTRPKVLFPRITRLDAEKDVISMLKYLANFIFYKFGIEVERQPTYSKSNLFKKMFLSSDNVDNVGCLDWNPNGRCSFGILSLAMRTVCRISRQAKAVVAIVPMVHFLIDSCSIHSFDWNTTVSLCWLVLLFLT